MLERISSAADLRSLSMEERIRLADEVRSRIIEVVCRNGGHLASSLGVVELTIAMLSVYDPEVDRIIWDVGHQSYPWKILTGRADRFDTIRTTGGLSGFPRRDESRCDAFGTGHSSTAISAALGFALSRDIRSGSERVVAVVGDGAMTGGMALEGLNNLGQAHTDMTVILNDNEMSISKNVGAIHRHLTQLITDPTYNRLRNELWSLLGKVPSVGERMRRAGHIVGAAIKKTLVSNRTIFDDFGVRYIGPVPGHDLPTLTGVLAKASALRGPVLIHVVTRKGKGYDPAECDATTWHGVSGEACEAPGGPTFTSAFSSAMVDLGKSDPRVVAITAAMRDGTGLREFASAYPGRFFDVGIAEQHAVTFACGLAFGGLRPVVAIYSTFMQRAVDQLIHDAALQRAPVTIALDRAGVVGEDGPTHHGVFDIPLVRAVPDVRLASPRSCAILASILRLAIGFDEGPTVIRYPRGSEPGPTPPPPPELMPGSGQLLRPGGGVLLVACGVLAYDALEAARLLESDGISAAVYDPIWLKPAPMGEILALAKSCARVVSVEDGCVSGGFGEMLAAELSLEGVPVRALGFPDMFQPSGTRAGLLARAGLDPESIRLAVKEICR
jgi:1-deoxy-D-xylulose-5-phosphate synthase